MKPLLYAPVGAARSGLLQSDDGAAASPITWETATDWDNAVSESGVAHESTTNTDHDDATIVKQGYAIASPSPSTDLVGYWPLHEDSGTTAYDFSTNGNNGSTSGATVDAAGLFDTTAYSFDGSDDYVDTTYSNFSKDSASAGLSISMWVNTTDSGSKIALFGAYDGNTPFIFVQSNKNGSAGNVEWGIRDDNANNNGVHTSGSLINDGSWHHVVCVVSGSSASDMSIYVDASSKSLTISNDQGHGAGTNPGAPYIGARSNGGSDEWHYNADITDVRVYDQALSSSQVQTLYDVADTAGSLETSTKSFNSAQSPDLVADAQLNGVTDIAVDVIGSPSGASETNTVQVNSSGENTYSITWSSSHTNFRVKPKPDNESDVTRTPTVNKLELSP